MKYQDKLKLEIFRSDNNRFYRYAKFSVIEDWLKKDLKKNVEQIEPEFK